MAGGYETPDLDGLDVLRRRLDEQDRRLAELERPTGTQSVGLVKNLAAQVTVAASGGSYNLSGINTVTPAIVWANNATFPAVNVNILPTLSGRVLVTVGALINLSDINTASSSGTLTCYVSYSTDGSNVGNPARALSSSTRSAIVTPPDFVTSWIQASATFLRTFPVGADVPVQMCVGYNHSSTSTGQIAVQSMNLSVQVLA